MALQRALRRVFATVLALAMASAAPGSARGASGTASSSGQSAGGDLFDEIFRRGAPVEKTLQTVSATFVETSTSTLLKAPQVARGTLVGQRPNRVRLVYAGVDARTVIVNGNTLALDWPARNLKETRDIGGTMRRAERFFVMSSPAELRKHFDIVAVEAPDRAGAWRVTFTPKRKQMREGVSRVHLWIDQATLVMRALAMDYPGGDTRLMEFSDVRVNPPVDAGAFAVPTRR
ncbi:LolA family protein [Luteitalea sp.]|jgi:outer membrane lipoprotein-sorting protein